MIRPVYVGFDSRQPVAAHVCRHSILRRSPQVHAQFLQEPLLRQRALYWRQSEVVDGVTIDSADKKPFSTEFSFSRFLVPFLRGQQPGWALFCDDDFLFMRDIEELFALADDRYAVMCVQHNHAPTEALKMDGRVQTTYRRKNWSSLVLWNCSHPANRALSVQDVNTQPGSWLHAFSWLRDEDIGALPEDWNWLVGVSPTTGQPVQTQKALHYTLGGPWFENRRNTPLGRVWLAEKAHMDAQLERAVAAD